MTSGESSGASAAKLGGYTLIGVGALAAVVGVTTAFTGGTQDSAEAPVASPPSSSAPSPEQPERPAPQQPGQIGQPGQPGDSGQNGQPGQSQGSNPGGRESGGDGQAQTPPPPRVPGGSDQASPKTTVRVYNNSTVKGLAHRAADDFRAAGYDVPEAGNYPSGKISTTTVYFRPGTEEEAQAKQVADQFGARAEPRFEGLEPASPGVIALITDDYKGPQ